MFLRIKILCLTACLAPAAFAQEAEGFDAGLALAVPNQSTTALTHAGGVSGGAVEGGYQGILRGTRIPYRVSVSVTGLRGREVDYAKSSLIGLQAAADVLVDIGVPKVALVTGLSLNSWRWDYQDKDQHVTPTFRGAKIGGRVGFDVRVSPRTTASLLLQMTEMGTDSTASKAYNPSWVQAGLRFRF